MPAFHSLARPSTLGALLVLGSTAIAAPEDYPTSAPPVTQPVYRCGSHAYSHVPCAGGVQVGGPRVTRTFEKTPPPQDRARQMARAVLPPGTREKCADLDAHIREGEAKLRARNSPPTEQEEGDLAILRVRSRELRC